MERWQRVAVGTALVGTVAVCAPSVLLGAAGFGALGPVAGGLAASVQTATTVAGGVFATMQSAGMAGVAWSTTAAAAGTGSAIGAWIGSKL